MKLWILNLCWFLSIFVVCCPESVLIIFPHVYIIYFQQSWVPSWKVPRYKYWTTYRTFPHALLTTSFKAQKKKKQKRVFRRRKVGNVFKKVDLERGVPPSGANLQRSIWKAPNSVKAIYCKILLLFLIIFCFAMIFQLFVILNKVSKSAEIAFLEFQLLILQEMEHGNIFFQLKYFPKFSQFWN